MKKIRNISVCLLSALLLIACTPEEKQQERPAAASNDSPAQADTAAIRSASEKTEEPIAICDCHPIVDYGYHSEVTISYYNDELYQQEQDSILQHHLHNPQSLKTKTLHLRTRDAFHPEIKKFREVEHVVLNGDISPTALKNLDLFPKLVSVMFEAATVEIDTTQAWLGRVEQLRFIKCKMKGLRSFKQTPRLKSLIIGHSGFEYFPKDFNALSCLQEFNIEEYKFGKDHPHIEAIDLRRFACLKTFRVWGGASGLPQGVDSIGKIKLILRPWAMSDVELKTYKAWKKRIKNAG